MVSSQYNKNKNNKSNVGKNRDNNNKDKGNNQVKYYFNKIKKPLKF